MPTFNFRCKKCDTRWDEFVQDKSQKPKLCPSCGESDQNLFLKSFVFDTKNSEQAFRPYEKGEKLNEFIKEAKESLSEYKQEKITNDTL